MNPPDPNPQSPPKVGLAGSLSTKELELPSPGVRGARNKNVRATYAGGEFRPPMALPQDAVPQRRKIPTMHQQDSPLDQYRPSDFPPRRGEPVVRGEPIVRGAPIGREGVLDPNLQQQPGQPVAPAAEEGFFGNLFGWGNTTAKVDQKKVEEEKKQKEYEMMLKEAHTQDFSDLEKFGFLYVSGTDKEKRPIVVFLASRVPARIASLERILLYCLKVLDPLVVNDYCVLYVHTGFRSENQPTFAFLKRCYGLFRRDYKKNLKCLMIVQPTFWVKGALQFSRALVSEKFWKKLSFAESLGEIHAWSNTITLPEGIIKSLQIMAPATPAVPAAPVAAPPPRRDIFGVELTKVMEHPMNQGLKIPLVVSSCLKYLFTEGISTVGLFRVPGNKNLMLEVIQNFDHGQTVDFTQNQFGLDSADVGGILKQYVRDLPTPILLSDLYFQWVTATIAPEPEQTIANIKSNLSQLPAIHFNVLAALIHLLKTIAESSEVNKMTPQNLAIVWGPNLLRAKDSSPATELAYTGQINTLTVLLITKCNHFFPTNPLFEECAQPQSNISQQQPNETSTEGSAPGGTEAPKDAPPALPEFKPKVKLEEMLKTPQQQEENNVGNHDDEKVLMMPPPDDNPPLLPEGTRALPVVPASAPVLPVVESGPVKNDDVQETKKEETKENQDQKVEEP